MTKSSIPSLCLESLEDSALTRLEQELAKAINDCSEGLLLRCEGEGFRYIQGWQRVVDTLKAVMNATSVLEFVIPDSQSRALARSAGLPLIARLSES